jgi:radical SAM protein with 4Fe4S-binding SPASM domain
MANGLPQEFYVEVTNRCNSRCQTCPRTFETLEPPRDLTLSEFHTIVDQVPLLRRVALHGVGEPLLNRDLPAMIAYLKQRADAPLVVLNSNAILLTPRIRTALIEAGLDQFRVSTDAAHRELYVLIRGVDAFDKVVRNVGAFAAQTRKAGHGPRLSLWFTAMRENLADLPELVRLAHRLGVGEVYVQRLVFYGLGLAQQEQSLFRAMQDTEVALLGEAEALARSLQLSLRASGATSPRESLNGPGGDGIPWAGCRRPQSVMYITANGNVLPCCLSPFTTRDYAGLVLGNVFREGLAEVWNGTAVRRFRALQQSDEPPSACEHCGVLWSL